jgi:hypothetical protein
VRSDHPMMNLLFMYCALCCACLYSSSSLWPLKSEGNCRFSLRLTFNGLLNSVTKLFSCPISRLQYSRLSIIRGNGGENWRG